LSVIPRRLTAAATQINDCRRAMPSRMVKRGSATDYILDYVSGEPSRLREFSRNEHFSVQQQSDETRAIVNRI
jgi:hypothetical protein